MSAGDDEREGMSAGAPDGEPREAAPASDEPTIEDGLDPDRGLDRDAGAVELDLFGKPPPSGKRDWSHRRAEPRALALLWTVFLLLATVWTFVSAGADGLMSVESYRASARGLLTVMMVGVSLLWPIARLSQTLPTEGGLRGSAKDVFVVVFPAQAILWPQALLARWPVEVMAASVSLLTAWALVVGGLLAVALRTPGGERGEGASWALSGWGAAGWSCVFVGLGLCGPVVVMGWSWASGGFEVEDALSRAGWMLSPWTGQAELVRDRSWTGRSAWASPSHWRWIGVISAFGLAAWGWAWGVSRRG